VSEPANATTPWDGDGSDRRDRSRRLRRVGEHASLMIVALVALLVFLSSWPVWLGVVDGERPAAAQRGFDRHLRARGWAVGAPREATPSRYAPTPDAYRVDAPGAVLGELLRSMGSTRDAEGHGAVSRGRIELLDRADDDGEVVLEVDADQPLLVGKDLGAWLMVAVRQDGRTKFGWVRRGEVVILP
jgi:hypothetical protein